MHYVNKSLATENLIGQASQRPLFLSFHKHPSGQNFAMKNTNLGHSLLLVPTPCLKNTMLLITTSVKAENYGC